MATGGGSENPPPVKEEDPPVTGGSFIPTAEKGEVCPISSRRPTPQGQRGGEADDEEREEDGASTRARTEPGGIEGVQVPGMDEMEDRVLLVPAPVEKEEGSIAEGGKSLTPEAVAEIAESFFKCLFCRNLMYDPAVIACGHMLCLGCVRSSMNIVESSECPLCHSLYNYVPRSCELIRDLVMKLQPLEMGTEETQGGDTSTFSADRFAEDDKVMEPTYAYQCSVQKEDVSCVLCHDLLYQPTILNCGHVFCILCIGQETEECPTCGNHHPCGPLAICSYLDNFIQDFFPTAYKSSMKKSRPFSGTTKKRVIINSNGKLSHTHVGVGCDFCGVYPIKGDRFSCKTCKKFDLCAKCAKTDARVEGCSGQLHLPDHVLELNNSFLLSKVIRVLDNNEEPDEKGAWEWRPAQLLPWGGVWDEGQQAPQDEDGTESEDYGSESEDSVSEDASGNEFEDSASGNEFEDSASEDDG